MARPLRIQLRNGWYHVTARGNNRQRIYLDARDRRHLLELLAEMRERQALEVHAFVLMDNHYHLLVRTPHANLSAAIQWLNVAYSVWWNRRHGRTGHVFQGRFKAVVVESGKWVLEGSLYLFRRWCGPWRGREGNRGESRRGLTGTRGWRWRSTWRAGGPGGVDYTAVSMAIKRFGERLARDQAPRTLTERLLDGSKCET